VVTTDRVFSIRVGLDASTVTPGNTAPDVSLTTPVIDPCAYNADGSTIQANVNRILETARITPPISLRCRRPWKMYVVYSFRP
jgi:hypothetical protein